MKSSSRFVVVVCWVCFGWYWAWLVVLRTLYCVTVVLVGGFAIVLWCYLDSFIVLMMWL